MMKNIKTMCVFALLATFTLNPSAGQADEGPDQLMLTHQSHYEKALKELESIDIVQSNYKEENKLNDLISELSDTAFELGKCKNTNMDYEVYALEILQEIDRLKKEIERVEEQNKQLEAKINKRWF